RRGEFGIVIGAGERLAVAERPAREIAGHRAIGVQRQEKRGRAMRQIPPQPEIAEGSPLIIRSKALLRGAAEEDRLDLRYISSTATTKLGNRRDAPHVTPGNASTAS